MAILFFELPLVQVYRGCTTSGEEVAVKVQRPDLLFQVARDVYILRIGVQAQNL